MKKLITEKSCLAEMERICRVIAYSAVDLKDLNELRVMLRPVLEGLGTIRAEKEHAKEQRAAAKKHAEQMRPYTKNTVREEYRADGGE